MREIDNRVTMLRIWTDGKMDRIGQPGIFLSLIFKIKLLKILFIYITKNVLYLFRIIILYIFIFFKMVREESKCEPVCEMDKIGQRCINGFSPDKWTQMAGFIFRSPRGVA